MQYLMDSRYAPYARFLDPNLPHHARSALLSEGLECGAERASDSGQSPDEPSRILAEALHQCRLSNLMDKNGEEHPATLADAARESGDRRTARRVWKALGSTLRRKGRRR